jgi:hypothetical protein
VNHDKIGSPNIEDHNDILKSFQEDPSSATSKDAALIFKRKGKNFVLNISLSEILANSSKIIIDYDRSDIEGDILPKSLDFKEIDDKIAEKIFELIKNGPELISEISYSDWKLRIKFSDPERVKGILTIIVGEKKIFDEPLRGKKEISIPYIPIKTEEKIIFKIEGQEKLVTRSIEFYENLDDLKVCILEHDCMENILINNNILNIAVVQLRYEIKKDCRVIKLTIDESSEKKKSGIWKGDEADIFRKEKEAYWKKIRYVLEAVKEKAKIIVFPEFSIPFAILPEIQRLNSII